ncbi:ATP-binding protein [Paenibacillus sp. FSL H3-0333]|uniref:ATP-binding protein n=1 Tax=Paenibacillus sp. FSL H3-0333 TaxID=2921373 RepID=UPI0030F6AFFE
MTNEIFDLEWDPYRTLFGLGRIGYTPPAAIGDILDNSVRARSNNIQIIINKINPASRDARKNNVKEYVIIDDGRGMSEKEILDALKLGSPDTNYDSNSLSKFGLGLKSAAFSQGNTLEVISSNGDKDFKKFIVSLSEIKASGKYFSLKVDPSDEDINLIQNYLSNNHGTIVRISDIRLENHPSVKATLDELEYKLGVIYYYFIKENGLKISILNGDFVTKIEPYDVLFTQEANDAVNGGNLDEDIWDGLNVKWIKKPKEAILLDPDYGVHGTIEVTQLPYPPAFKPEDSKIRQKYKIEANNYGFYVYRNKRLISWAERFGIIPLDQDYYSFRGRIIIDDSADNAFNIDVKKSSIILSDEAQKTISDLSDDYKRKSKKAWKHANELLKQKEGLEPSETSNQLVLDYEVPDLSTEPILNEEEERSEQIKRQELGNDMKKKMKQIAAEEKSENEGREVSEEELSDEDINTTLKGTNNPKVEKIFRVNSVDDNLLWEPYFDAEQGHCVRINKKHRFSKVVFEDNSMNTDLQVIYDLLLYNFALAEVKARTSNVFEGLDTEGTILEYRRIVSEYLASFVRTKENKLPPLNKDSML